MLDQVAKTADTDQEEWISPRVVITRIAYPVLFDTLKKLSARRRNELLVVLANEAIKTRISAGEARMPSGDAVGPADFSRPTAVTPDAGLSHPNRQQRAKPRPKAPEHGHRNDSTPRAAPRPAAHAELREDVQQAPPTARQHGADSTTNQLMADHQPVNAGRGMEVAMSSSGDSTQPGIYEDPMEMLREIGLPRF